MNIDMTQVHQVFFEESFEGLDVMEGGLLHIAPGTVDAEQVNAIFRVAHSIKGASGTFGFAGVADFTHVIEALLDEMRGGRRLITAAVIDTLLRSVDVLREMLAGAQRGVPADVRRVERQRRELEKLSDADGAAPLSEPLERRSDSDRRRVADRCAVAAQSMGKSASIRVETQKIDALISRVDELLLTQSRLERLGQGCDSVDMEQFRAGLAQLGRETLALHQSVMQIQMVPISFVFSRLPRMVHDLGHRFGKKIELNLIGADIEVDKTVAEKIVDPLVHLVRNSLDHGIETPAQRLAVGKPELGAICLSAARRGGDVVLTVRDDGRGLSPDRIRRRAVERGLAGAGDTFRDNELFELICRPGFSTAEMVSDISGRGVGMDVVRRNIDELGGTVDIDSTPGAGCTITIGLPSTPADERRGFALTKTTHC